MLILWLNVPLIHCFLESRNILHIVTAILVFYLSQICSIMCEILERYKNVQLQFIMSHLKPEDIATTLKKIWIPYLSRLIDDKLMKIF